jgi:acetoin utilization protein AcuB
VRPLDSIRHAREMMESYRINQLPVVDHGHLVGIITDRDLRDAYPSVFESAAYAARITACHDHDPERIPVDIVMTSEVLTLTPHNTLEDATRLMRRERIGAVPIVERGRLVGIITRTDVLDAFLESVAPGHAASARTPIMQRPAATRAA